MEHILYAAARSVQVNYTGILLLVLAAVLFGAEFFAHSFGLFTAGGLTALIIGLLLLFPGLIPAWVIVLIVVVVAGLISLVVIGVVHAHRQQPVTGKEELIGKVANARSRLDPEGLVFYDGERWDAVSESGPVEEGQEVIITRIEGLKLYVKKKE
jgi:membrane-bound serine protease (ClpP class)